MMSSLLKVYNVLPPTLRSVAASARGYYLRSWRYGARTEALIEAARMREMWTEREWVQWRAERLEYILDRAATCVPYYRALWRKRRKTGDTRSWLKIENWPVLDKSVVRGRESEFVASDCDRSRLFEEHTSGTSGTPLTLWWGRETVEEWYALFERRWRQWYEVSRHDRWAILGGQMVTPSGRAKPPYWVWNQGLNQLYLSIYHISTETIPTYVEALNRYRPAYLFGYPSALYSLAQGIIDLGARVPPMKVVITNAEPVWVLQKRAIERAFACPVRETYGMAEIVAAAGECEHGTLHLWPEVGFTELMVEGRIKRDADEGEMVCTGLINDEMPLIRYKVGDRLRREAGRRGCRCGRTLPVVERIEGRSDDVVITGDGRQVGRLDPVFKGDFEIEEAQIIQESVHSLKVRYVPSGTPSEKNERRIARALKERVGEVEIAFERVNAIPRGSNGKFRSVISYVDAKGVEESKKLMEEME